jgi:hypothetical protein
MAKKATARVWGVALLVGAALLAGTPAASAAPEPAPRAAATQSVPAPHMTGAWLCNKYTAFLGWTSPVPGVNLVYYVYADGRFVGTSHFTTMDIYDIREAHLTGTEEFTVVADLDGDLSAPSNALTPVVGCG